MMYRFGKRLLAMIGLAAVVAVGAVPAQPALSADRGEAPTATAVVGTPARGVLLAASAGVREVSGPGGKLTVPKQLLGTGGAQLAAASPTCWTAFAPPVPAGAALAHWYRNCGATGTY